MAGITKRFDVFIQAATKYKNCPAGAATTLKNAGAGAAGDYLGRLICVISNNQASNVDITDGSLNAVRVVPVGNAISTANGVISLDFGIESVNGNWTITTGNGVNVLATGIFD